MRTVATRAHTASEGLCAVPGLLTRTRAVQRSLEHLTAKQGLFCPTSTEGKRV